jgi:hypothetical protein
MQTQIAFITMEAKYIALSQAIEKIMTPVFQVSKTISYQTYSKSVYSNDNNVEKYNITQSTVFEDNDA